MKIITTLLAIIFATSAYADKVQIVNPGSEEGAFRQVLTTIGKSIEHDFVQANNPVTAYSYIDGADKPIVTIWSSEWPGDKQLISPAVNEDNLIALMTYETMMCSRDFTSLEDMAGKQIKIATWGSKPVEKFLKKLSSQTGADFIVVPFGGSGSTTKGYLAGDANTVFTITTRQSAIEEDKSTTCFAFSETGDLGFRFVDAIVTVDATKKINEKLRAVIAALSNQQEWKTKFSGTSTYVGPQHKPMFDEAVKNFSK